MLRLTCTCFELTRGCVYQNGSWTMSVMKVCVTRHLYTCGAHEENGFACKNDLQLIILVLFHLPVLCSPTSSSILQYFIPCILIVDHAASPNEP